MTKYYFAYGSNMDKEDLDKWCDEKQLPHLRFLEISPVKLSNYKLSFNYYSSTRDAGAANIIDSQEDTVYGLLMQIDDKDIEIIRRKEGFPNCYDEIYVKIEKFDGTLIQGVLTYKVAKNKELLTYQPPTQYYMNLIIKNAENYEFPREYIKFLKTLKTTK
ncbi:MAG: gamma-glutamylcyclotransferase family protein [Armatimonadota bacterium]